jgi:hypothetical protein
MPVFIVVTEENKLCTDIPCGLFQIYKKENVVKSFPRFDTFFNLYFYFRNAQKCRKTRVVILSMLLLVIWTTRRIPFVLFMK